MWSFCGALVSWVYLSQNNGIPWAHTAYWTDLDWAIWSKTWARGAEAMESSNNQKPGCCWPRMVSFLEPFGCLIAEVSIAYFGPGAHKFIKIEESRTTIEFTKCFEDSHMHCAWSKDVATTGISTWRRSCFRLTKPLNLGYSRGPTMGGSLGSEAIHFGSPVFRCNVKLDPGVFVHARYACINIPQKNYIHFFDAAQWHTWIKKKQNYDHSDLQDTHITWLTCEYPPLHSGVCGFVKRRGWSEHRLRIPCHRLLCSC